MKPLSRRLMFVTILLLATQPVLPAAAADEIGLSRDGVTWSSSLSGELFNTPLVWVPGDSEIETFYVRNQGPSSAFLSIEARSADTDRLLSNTDITLRARVDAGAWMPLENGVPNESLTEQTVGHGEAARVDVDVAFNPASTNQSQGKSVELTFSVRLVEALPGDDGGADEAGSDDGGIDGILPGVGSQVSVWLLLGAGVMAAVGLRLVRRQEARHD